jgi:hypothetical protein
MATLFSDEQIAKLIFNDAARDADIDENLADSMSTLKPK